MQVTLEAVTDHVHFARTELVNWTLVTGSAGVVLIDAGYPGQRAEVLECLRRLGHRPEDVRAVLLTHAHVDHLGTAIWFAATFGTPVYCHAAEVGHVKREYLEQVSPAPLAAQMWRPRWLAWSLAAARRGGLVRDGVPSAQPLTAEVAAELPGRPTAVPSPGHTGGHCSYLVDGVLVAGDALVTAHPVTPRRGPQLLPAVFNHDQRACERSLAALGLLDTEVLLPGHGPIWRGPVREAAALAAPAVSRERS